MKYDFDQMINRENTACEKWDGLKDRFGVSEAIPMWVADMDFKSPPPVIEALSQRVQHGIFGYTNRPDSYFEAIIDWGKRRHHWSIDKKWIAHSPGILPALSSIINSFSQQGDKVIIQTPVYHPFSQIIKSLGRESVSNPLKLENSRYMIDIEDLKEKIDPTVKILVLCNPHNPVGRVWSEEELTMLGQICIENNILVVSDEIHCDLVFRGNKHIPFASLSEEFANLTFTCIAASKTFNIAGLQTSSIIIPNQKLRDIFNKAINNQCIGSPNTFGMVAAESAYRYGEEWLEELIDYLQGNLDFLICYFQKNIPQIKVIRPESTFLVWLDCRELGLAKNELDELMLSQAKVAMNEGYIFGVDGEGFMRMNIGCSRSLLEKCLRQIDGAVNFLCRA
ncbi:pyridoxal phosphate-dependent aminotransferase [Bacillus sp. FJAT-29790]|uniref:MalY/PatB family protein n=1 Tax=Bacillus sp. FJAT-29790 TaxID=1895002 RepID=UPI001C242E6A|nr:MalY/PatB family protein [Bacillus sp. FJAT-29790]MBU8878412.1 pyridoxal phosphate-dependent aminotransferase [Bacillus sp. FJAT-29790]